MVRRRPRPAGVVLIDAREPNAQAFRLCCFYLPLWCAVRGGGVLPRRREARRVGAIGGGDGSGAADMRRERRARRGARVPMDADVEDTVRRRGGFRRGGCLPERSARLPERRRGGRRARPASITPSTGRVPAHPDRGVDVSHRQSRVELVSPRRTRRRVSAVRAHGVRHVHARAGERLRVRPPRSGRTSPIPGYARDGRGNATEGVARVDEALEMGTRDSEGSGARRWGEGSRRIARRRTPGRDRSSERARA